MLAGTITNGQAIRFVVTNDPYFIPALRALKKARAAVSRGLRLADKITALREFDNQPFKF